LYDGEEGEVSDYHLVTRRDGGNSHEEANECPVRGVSSTVPWEVVASGRKVQPQQPPQLVVVCTMLTTFFMLVR